MFFADAFQSNPYETKKKGKKMDSKKRKLLKKGKQQTNELKFNKPRNKKQIKFFCTKHCSFIQFQTSKAFFD